MNVVIACGGTGGHLFPGLAVGEKLREHGHESLIIISEKDVDTLAVRDHVGEYRFERLPAIGMPRLLSPAIVGFTRGFANSLVRCRNLYREFKPHAVLGMGGFTSTAPMLIGRQMGMPTFIHESNAIPGKANRLNARLAKAVLLGFGECAKYFPHKTTCVVTGTPIRSSLQKRLDSAEARSIFGLNPAGHEKTLLIMGGSQGAHGLNQAVLEAMPRWKGFVQVIHLTGRSDEAKLRAAYRREGMHAYVAGFHHRMQEAYSAADLTIARSGAASLSELAHFALPSILIPFPAAAEDHQTFNAKIFVEAGAALMLSERDFDGNKLSRLVSELLQDQARTNGMSAAAHRLSPVSAASLVVETLEAQCHL